MRLAVDVMGGDHAPDAILKGSLDALDVLAADDELILIGPEGVIREHLAERGVSDPRVTIVHAPEVIPMDEAPTRAVRQRTESSIVKMALLGSSKADQAVDVVISAGNTGACVAAAIMHMKRLPGVHRPGIAVTIPAFHGPIVLCDAGANPEPRGTHLWQYGVMADVYAREVLGIESPRVALMNIGSEEAKGSDLVKSARDLLRATPGINFTGFVEGRDFFAGAADVIITDGFVGNTVLKMAEGMAKSLFQAIAQEIFELDPNLAIQFEPVVKQIYAKNDYHEYGGAPLLGVNGAMMIAHGSSEARTIRAAIRNARDFVAHDVNRHITDRLGELDRVCVPTDAD
ncbi:MAG: phosphate acyltransferase PlsX [Phycisphaeraceae bacterium]|nr:MAG: phosphate acyltransferase PlsX [Phycisphaeraceae bacterium]